MNKSSTYLSRRFSSSRCKGNVKQRKFATFVCVNLSIYLTHILERRRASARGAVQRECYKVANLGGDNLS